MVVCTLTTNACEDLGSPIYVAAAVAVSDRIGSSWLY